MADWAAIARGWLRRPASIIRVIDLETTALAPEDGEIIEIGWQDLPLVLPA